MHSSARAGISACSFPSVKQVEGAKYARAPRSPIGSNSSSSFLIWKYGLCDDQHSSSWSSKKKKKRVEWVWGFWFVLVSPTHPVLPHLEPAALRCSRLCSGKAAGQCRKRVWVSAEVRGIPGAGAGCQWPPGATHPTHRLLVPCCFLCFKGGRAFTNTRTSCSGIVLTGRWQRKAASRAYQCKQCTCNRNKCFTFLRQDISCLVGSTVQEL